MAATKAELSAWFDEGVKQSARFMVVVCDTFDHEDYPVYADADTVHETFDHHNGPNMQRVMEVYDLAADKSEQMGGLTVRLPARAPDERLTR